MGLWSFRGLLRPAVAGAFLLCLLLPTALPARAEALRLMVFGDSLAHGYGLDAGETFPDQLERALRTEGREVEVLNAGNSGDTTAAGLARLDWALAEAPDAAIVILGANDMLRGLEPAAARGNLAAILERLKAAETPTLLAGMLAGRNLGTDYAEEFDAIYPGLAAEYGVLLYPFFLEGVAGDPLLNQADGIHPNPAGVARIVEQILPQVRQLLAEVPAGRADGRAGDG